MSLGYAEKLSYRKDVGDVGMSEIFDPPAILQQKIGDLAAMIQKSKHLVAFTGAGISTSCGIPDFRGPKGVWTLQRKGKGFPNASFPFHRAVPSLTHMALVELEKAGILKFVVSQNVDCLHLRSGISRRNLAELHGNSFREICSSCGAEYLRDFEVETIGMKETPRHCTIGNCGAKLKDTVLDWEDALPLKEINPAEHHCKMADVVLCLGTSLQVTPACNLPLKSTRGGGKIVIVNLQQTPKDGKASLVIHGVVDKVIDGVMQNLNLRIPPYVRLDFFQVILYRFHRESEKKFVKWTLRVTSKHGIDALIPFIQSVEISFPDRPKLKMAILRDQPFILRRYFREMVGERSFRMGLKLNLSDGCGCASATMELPVNLQEAAEIMDNNEDVVVEKLRDAAMEAECCGQISMVRRDKLVSPSDAVNTISVYAIATNIVWHGGCSLQHGDAPQVAGHGSKQTEECLLQASHHGGTLSKKLRSL